MEQCDFSSCITQFIALDWKNLFVWCAINWMFSSVFKLLSEAKILITTGRFSRIYSNERIYINLLVRSFKNNGVGIGYL